MTGFVRVRFRFKWLKEKELVFKVEEGIKGCERSVLSADEEAESIKLCSKSLASCVWILKIGVKVKVAGSCRAMNLEQYWLRLRVRESEGLMVPEVVLCFLMAK